MMKENAQKTLKELQMEELKETFGVEKDPNEKKNPSNARSANSEKIAKLYDDAGEYEEDLRIFEEEVTLIHANSLANIVDVLNQTFPNYEGNYAKELQTVLEAGWKQLVEVKNTHPKEQLTLLKEKEFKDALSYLSIAYPEYNDFENDIRNILIKRWEMLLAIKKEHIKEELAEMKLRGMKPDHVRKVYRRFHGLD